MAFNVSKAFGYEKDLLYEYLTVISASKDGNNIIFMDKNRSFYELLRESISEGYNDELAKAVATIIESNYTDVNFTIFETRQFNEFMNLQIGKNTIMFSVVKLRRNFMKTHLFFPDPDHQPKILAIPFATLFRGSSKCPPSFHSKNSFSTFGSSLRISA